MLQDLRLVLETIGRPQGFIDSVVRTSLKDYNSQWRKYKRWCLEEGLHPWLSFDHTQVSVTSARDQLMAFLDFVKPSMMAYSTFCNHKSAIVCSFRILFGFELGKDPLITQWMKGWKIELPPQPRCSPDEDGWDVGAIVQY